MAKLLRGGSCAAGLSWPRIGPFLEAPAELQAPLRLHIAIDNDPLYEVAINHRHIWYPSINIRLRPGLLQLGE